MMNFMMKNFKFNEDVDNFALGEQNQEWMLSSSMIRNTLQRSASKAVECEQ